jgi:HEAT repeat protein
MQEIKALLKNDDVEVRREAIESLRGKPGVTSIDLLLSAMEDRSWRVRHTATDILIDEHPVQEYIKGLIELLYQDENAGARNSAIEALVRLNKKITPYLIEAFNTPNRDVRKFIIDVLGEYRDHRSLPLMLEALKDDDENVRATAIEHIGKVGESSVVDALIEIIEGDDLWTAYPATDALGRIGDRKALPALIKSLEKKTLRAPAIKSISSIADPETIKHIIPYLRDPSKTVKEEVLRALERFYHNNADEQLITSQLRNQLGDEALDILLKHAWSQKHDVRVSAILMLGLMQDEKVYNPLLDISQEENYAEDVKKAFVFIGQDKPESLLPLLETDSLYQKRFICEIAGRIASPVYTPIFTEYLTHEDGHMRSIAAFALSKIGNPDTIKSIEPLLADEFTDVQEAAVEALSTFGKHLSVVEYMSLLHNENPSLRKNAALILGKIRAHEAVPALGFALKDGNVEVRKACVEAFSLLQTSDSVNFLILALTDENPSIRVSAALSLGLIGGEGVSEALSNLLSDSEDAVRVAVSKAFGMLADVNVVKLLIALLSDKNGFVVTTTIESLSSIGGEEARSALLRMLSHDDKEVVRTTIQALEKFDNIEDSLLPFLSHDDWSTRLAAVEVLGRGFTDRVRQELEKLVDIEEDPIVLKAVRESLKDNR